MTSIFLSALTFIYKTGYDFLSLNIPGTSISFFVFGVSILFSIVVIGLVHKVLK